jgi:hypothetical protein
MNSTSLFKLAVILITWLKITLVSLPFSIALVNLKKGKFQYGYDYFELDYKAAILIAISLGIIFSVWNAFEHAKREDMDPRQFMKAKQKYQLKQGAEISKEQIQSRLKALTEGNRRCSLLSESGSANFKMGVKNKFGAKDVVTISRHESSWMLVSRPKWLIDSIDLARNFDNIKMVSKEIQK